MSALYQLRLGVAPDVAPHRGHRIHHAVALRVHQPHSLSAHYPVPAVPLAHLGVWVPDGVRGGHAAIPSRCCPLSLANRTTSCIISESVASPPEYDKLPRPGHPAVLRQGPDVLTDGLDAERLFQAPLQGCASAGDKYHQGAARIPPQLPRAGNHHVQGRPVHLRLPLAGYGGPRQRIVDCAGGQRLQGILPGGHAQRPVQAPGDGLGRHLAVPALRGHLRQPFIVGPEETQKSISLIGEGSCPVIG